MKKLAIKMRLSALAGSSTAEILVLPDGRIFAHNISPDLAVVLAALDPKDEAMRRRAGRKNTLKHEIPGRP
jgi:hypothetical protein